jgi:hypothetical protein
MKYLKMDGPYTDYGRPDMWDKNSKIKCCVDTHTRDTECKPNEQVALLIEPRSIQRDVYLKMENNYKNFKYVFTHDSKLLATLPNAKPIIWGGCWCRVGNPVIKDKFIGMICSHKKYAELHRVRLRTALKFKDRENFDLYGPYQDNERIDPMIAHERYRYVVVVENYIDDIWITEKIIDAFACKCIPIYLGARDICKYFNKDGIIQVKDEKELNNTIESMLNNVEYWKDFYSDINTQKAITENYNISKKYNNFEEWFYNTYEKEIEDMFKEVV